ncbi:MAG: HAMP domain-containing sensor histidine kinase [Bacteroidia bacterium]|nr:HAMP domain-containing sensor histidine kinase [Bacteroidia bacterium]
MKEIFDFFSHLLEAEYWPARWMCGIWTPAHGWTYILSSIGIGIAYCIIPVILFVFVRKRKDLPFIRIFWLFIVFILACGSTHLVDAMVFWLPAYRLSATVLFLTAIVSWLTVGGLIWVLPQALSLKTPAQFEAIIQARTYELSQSNQALKKINEAMDNYVYAASHNLKSPVSNIEGLLYILREQITQGEVPDPGILDRIQHSVHKVQASIQNLTEVIKMQKSPYEDKALLRISDLVALIQQENEMIIHRAGATIELALTIDELYYSANALKSILYNLITNAIKYADPRRLPQIRISTRASAAGVVLEVQDNGLGIDLDQHGQHLFGLFKRMHNHVEGSGIGLYFTKELIEKLGGHISVESTVGVGSVFTVVLYNTQ